MNSSSKFVRYLIGGLLIGAVWYINSGRPAWEEVLRTVVVFTIVMTFMKAKLKRKSVEVHLVPLVASKAVLLVIAAMVENQVKDSLNNAALLVSVGLAVAVTLLGPIGDSHFFSRVAPPMPLQAPAPAQRY